MTLFHQTPETNLLPFDGRLTYFPHFLDLEKNRIYFETFLHTIEWKQDEAILYGKHITTKRSVAWYADKGFSYRYSGTTKTALAWSKELLNLKEEVEQETKEIYNSCLLNLYHDGSEGMAWHSDDETSLKKNYEHCLCEFRCRKNLSIQTQKKETQ